MRKRKLKSATQKAVDAILHRREKRSIVIAVNLNRSVRGEELEKLPPALTIYKAAKLYGIHASGLSRALRKRLKEKRCESCGQVIR